MKSIAVYSTFLFAAAASGAEILKENNGDHFLLGSSWVGGVVPGPNDVALWDGNFTHNLLPRSGLNGDFTVLGFRSTINAAQKIQFDKSDPSGTEVLTTIGPAGISIENFGLGINLTSNVRLSADQTWYTAGSVADAGIHWLATFKGGNEGYVDFGGRTVTKTGAAPVTFSINTLGDGTVRNGTILMNGGELGFSSAAQYASNSPVPNLRVPSSLTIRLNLTTSLRPFNHHQTVENLVWNARVELNGGTLFGCGQTGDGCSYPGNLGGVIDVQTPSFLILPSEINNLTAEHTITAAITGSASLSLRNLTAASAQCDHRLVLAGNNSAFAGTFVLDGNTGRRSVRLRGHSAGSTSAACTISNLNTLEIEKSDVNLGSLAGTGNTGKVNAVGGGTSTVSIGARNTSTSFAGLLANDAGAVLALRKTGAGTLTLGHPGSAWAGDTIVESGSLFLNSQLDDASCVRIATGAVLRVKPGTADSVAVLFLGGSPVTIPGTYGAIGSTASFQSAHFSGTGILNVTSILGSNPYLYWAFGFPELDSAAERSATADPDSDGVNNLVEFITMGNPLHPGQNPLIRLHQDPGGRITYYHPVFGAPDMFTISAQASADMVNFNIPLTPASGFVPPPGSPALPVGWDYWAWRGPAGSSRLFYRTTVGPVPPQQ